MHARAAWSQRPGDAAQVVVTRARTREGSYTVNNSRWL
jgi:hypothetical protein